MNLLGNYRHYYKRRSNDSRVDSLSTIWFENKNCLDIGCNSGDLTLEIAKKYSPKSINGCDSDELLIRQANKKIENLKSKSVSALTSFIPRCLSNSKNAPGRFPNNISFICEDILASTIQPESCDTITCFSVTKWIHLQYGDAGLLQLFRVVYILLKVEGIFIVEYQGWSSYKNNRNTSEVTKLQFNEIKLFPEYFEEILTDIPFQFEIVSKLGVSIQDSKGFQRPILVLRKKKHVNIPNIDLKRVIRVNNGQSELISTSKYPTFVRRLIEKYSNIDAAGAVDVMSSLFTGDDGIGEQEDEVTCAEPRLIDSVGAVTSVKRTWESTVLEVAPVRETARKRIKYDS